MTKDFAVISINSKQYTVVQGSTLKVDRVPEGEEVNVMFAKIGDSSHVGEPVLSNVGVHLEVVEEIKAPKVGVRRYKSKSRYRKNKGHRQPISVLKIIDFGEKTKNELKWNIQEEKVEVSGETSKDTQKAEKPKKIDVEKNNEVKESKSESLQDLDLSDSIISKLEDAGYNDVKDVKNASRDDLLDIKGIGDKAVDKLLDEIK